MKYVFNRQLALVNMNDIFGTLECTHHSWMHTAIFCWAHTHTSKGTLRNTDHQSDLTNNVLYYFEIVWSWIWKRLNKPLSIIYARQRNIISTKCWSSIVHSSEKRNSYRTTSRLLTCPLCVCYYIWTTRQFVLLTAYQGLVFLFQGCACLQINFVRALAYIWLTHTNNHKLFGGKWYQARMSILIVRTDRPFHITAYSHIN